MQRCSKRPRSHEQWTKHPVFTPNVFRISNSTINQWHFLKAGDPYKGHVYVRQNVLTVNNWRRWHRRWPGIDSEIALGRLNRACNLSNCHFNPKMATHFVLCGLIDLTRVLKVKIGISFRFKFRVDPLLYYINDAIFPFIVLSSLPSQFATSSRMWSKPSKQSIRSWNVKIKDLNTF